MKNRFIIKLVLLLILIGCNKSETKTITEIDEIDSTFKFIKKKVSKIDNSSRIGTSFYLNNSKDSIYLIIKDGRLRSRGWVIGGKQNGNWKYETLNSKNVALDSIINFVTICNEEKLNTIKYFKGSSDSLIQNKGCYYDVTISEFSRDGNSMLNFEIQFHYDNALYDDSFGLGFQGFKDQSINDFCNYIDSEVESAPVVNNMVRIIISKPKIKGRYIFKGFYLLKYKSTIDHFKPIITQIEYEV